MPDTGNATEGLVRLELRQLPEPGRGSVVALVTLDDPSHRNMLSAAMVRDLLATMDAVENDPGIGAVVVTGSPPAFCAGGDLGALAAVRETVDEAGGKEALRGIYEGFLRVARCRLPTVAAVNGPAVGAGMNLALACDVRITGRSARFDTRFLDLGLHPGGAHTFMLSRLAGPEVAAAMVLFGQRLDGSAAVERGIAYACVDDGRLVEAAVELAARAASAPRALALRAKKTLGEVAGLDDGDKAVDIELDAQLWSIREPFFADRLAEIKGSLSRGEPKTEPA